MGGGSGGAHFALLAKGENENDEKEEMSTEPLPLSTYVVMLTCLGAISGFLFGCDTGMISGALLLIREEFGLSDAQEEVVVSGTVAGGIVGALVASKLDGVGRKPVIIASALVFVAGSLVMCLSRSYELLVCGRVLLGVAVGLSSATVPVYIAEASPAVWRGRLLLVFQTFLTFGQFAASLLNGILQDTQAGWRYVMVLSAACGVVQLVGFMYLDRSPRWLLSQGRVAEARAVFERIVPGYGDALYNEATGEGGLLVQEEEEEQEEEEGGHGLDEKNKEVQLGFWEMIKDRALRKIVLLGCSLQFFQQVCGINTIMYYSGSILLVAGFSRYWAVWFAALVALANWVATMAAVPLVDSRGRRPLVLWSAALVAMCLFALGWVSYAANGHSAEAQQLTGPWAPYAQSPCSSYTTCYQCAPDSACGFLYTTDGDGVVEGVCVRGDQGTYSDFGPLPQPWSENGVWSYDGCPADRSADLYNKLTIAFLMLYLVCFAPGLGAMPWAINSEIYPQRIRSLGMGLATGTHTRTEYVYVYTYIHILMCVLPSLIFLPLPLFLLTHNVATNWTTNFIVSVTFLTLMKALTPAYTFALYGSVAIVSFLTLNAALPETRGKSLREIEHMFLPREG
jgi:SP family myo-inositol transporter-like MFS transporter 13